VQIEKFRQANIQGEIMGVVLSGLIKSFKNINIISGDKAARLAANIQPTEWYPVHHFYLLLDSLTAENKDISSILLRAGMEFIEDWYVNGQGNKLINSSIDFLKFQAGSEGYKSVVRGAPDQVGRVDMAELEENLGRAVLVSTTPFPLDFERGVFYGGMLYPGDMEFVDVHCDSERTLPLLKKNITIHFRKKPATALAAEIEILLNEMSPSSSPPIPPEIALEILWKYKALQRRYEMDADFWEQLSDKISEIHILRGILPICSFCKKICNDEGQWQTIENYLSSHSEAQLSHGICLDCAAKQYPEFF
jgi:hypothetical protein